MESNSKLKQLTVAALIDAPIKNDLNGVYKLRILINCTNHNFSTFFVA
jgi:hypothetical protein